MISALRETLGSLLHPEGGVSAALTTKNLDATEVVNGSDKYMGERQVDQKIVELVQHGDKRAFELLVVKYERKLARLISRFVRNSSEVEDIVQESFIKAYRALPGFRGDSAFYTWLYRIGINTAKNHLANKARCRTMSINSADDDTDMLNGVDLLQDPTTPEQELLGKQVIATINKAIDSLPEDLRTAITLREIEGMNYEGIAEAMNCPIGTVRSRIFRAREAIAVLLRPLLDTSGNKRW